MLKLFVKQGITYVLVSLGKEGAMLVSEHGVWKGKAPEVEVKKYTWLWRYSCRLNVSFVDRRGRAIDDASKSNCLIKCKCNDI